VIHSNGWFKSDFDIMSIITKNIGKLQNISKVKGQMRSTRYDSEHWMNEKQFPANVEYYQLIMEWNKSLLHSSVLE